MRSVQLCLLCIVALLLGASTHCLADRVDDLAELPERPDDDTVIPDSPISLIRFPGFLPPFACEHLIRLGENEGFVEEPDDEAERTSVVAYLARGQDAIVKGVEQRLAAFVKLPVENLETIVIERAEEGQLYSLHRDGTSSIDQYARRISALIFLNELGCDDGGDMVFPELEDHVESPLAGLLPGTTSQTTAARIIRRL